MRQYIALIHKDADSDYGVSFPDLPGCVTAGVDLNDARAMAEEALALHLAGMADDEEPIPESSSLDAIMAERENRDAVAILVKAPPTTAKAVRVNVTIPEDELEQIDKFAAAQGYTRSGFLLHAAKRSIGEAEAANARTVTAKAGLADPLKRLAELIEISQAPETVQKAIEAALTGDALEKVVNALLRNEVRPNEVENVIEPDLKNGAKADKSQLIKKKVI
jgi:predicted RNase H-like HicB family nuclease/uncharacterized protein (DUF1778 family)